MGSPPRRSLLIRGAIAILLASVSAAASGPILGTGVTPTRQGQWLEDLRFLTQRLRERHPKLACGPTRVRFDEAATALEDRIGALPRHRAILELARLLALIEDGHTQLGLTWDDAIGFQQFPVRFYEYADGIFVRRTSREYGRLSGARLAGIGSLGVEEVIRRVRPLIHGDNEMTVRDVLPSRLAIPEVLEGIGATDDLHGATFRFAFADGSIEALDLRAIPAKAHVDWLSGRETSRPSPLYLLRPEDPYWFTYVESQKTVYLQFNAVRNKPEEDFASFIHRVFASIDSLPVERFILDIRHNNGGDNTLNEPLVRALIRSDKVNRKGHLFTIIGRLTFSAAMNLAVDLERHTETLFVGEPTGASPNHYGETESFLLPHSGIRVLYSSLYWQSSDPRDRRPWIEPHIAAALTSKDYRDNIDPAMEAALHYPRN